MDTMTSDSESPISEVYLPAGKKISIVPPVGDVVIKVGGSGPELSKIDHASSDTTGSSGGGSDDFLDDWFDGQKRSNKSDNQKPKEKESTKKEPDFLDDWFQEDASSIKSKVSKDGHEVKKNSAISKSNSNKETPDQGNKKSSVTSKLSVSGETVQAEKGNEATSNLSISKLYIGKDTSSVTKEQEGNKNLLPISKLVKDNDKVTEAKQEEQLFDSPKIVIEDEKKSQQIILDTSKSDNVKDNIKVVKLDEHKVRSETRKSDNASEPLIPKASINVDDKTTNSKVYKYLPEMPYIDKDKSPLKDTLEGDKDTLKDDKDTLKDDKDKVSTFHKKVDAEKKSTTSISASVQKQREDEKVRFNLFCLDYEVYKALRSKLLKSALKYVKRIATS